MSLFAIYHMVNKGLENNIVKIGTQPSTYPLY